MSTQTLNLSTPITRGEKQISEITLHKPSVGAVRGLSMQGLLNMNVDALITVLPRITDPKLTEAEVNNLDLPDLLQAGIVVASFFIPTTDTELMA